MTTRDRITLNIILVIVILLTLSQSLDYWIDKKERRLERVIVLDEKPEILVKVNGEYRMVPGTWQTVPDL